MDLVYFGNSGKCVLVLGIGLSVSAKGVSGLLGFLIFDSDSNLMKCSKTKIMGKDHLSYESALSIHFQEGNFSS